MCPHRDWFVTYEPVDIGIILMGNDTECKVVEMDIMQIKTYDGVVRTSSKGPHIPDMTYNFISLGTLEANSCRYSAENDVLKATKGVIVLMKGSR